MKKTQRVMVQRSIQAACIIGMGLTGLIGLLTLAGVESLHSVSSAVTESVASTWRAVRSMDVDDLLRQWIVGALGVVIFAAVDFCAVLLLGSVVQLLSLDQD